MRLLTDNEIVKLCNDYPIYSQDGKGGAQIALFHFFLGNADWYVLEGEKKGDVITLFGIVSLNGTVEYGYFTLNELEEISIKRNVVISETKSVPFEFHIEKDKYFTPTKLSELKANDNVIEFIRRHSKNIL